MFVTLSVFVTPSVVAAGTVQGVPPSQGPVLVGLGGVGVCSTYSTCTFQESGIMVRTGGTWLMTCAASMSKLAQQLRPASQ